MIKYKKTEDTKWTSLIIPMEFKWKPTTLKSTLTNPQQLIHFQKVTTCKKEKKKQKRKKYHRADLCNDDLPSFEER